MAYSSGACFFADGRGRRSPAAALPRGAGAGLDEAEALDQQRADFGLDLVEPVARDDSDAGDAGDAGDAWVADALRRFQLHGEPRDSSKDAPSNCLQCLAGAIRK